MYNPKTTEANDFQDKLNVIGDAAQRFGMKTFKMDDLEITFEPPRVVFAATSGMPNQAIGATSGMPTEDELLFASSIPLTEDELAARPPA